MFTSRIARPAVLALAAAALILSAAPARADAEDRLYDFTDAYYLRNGVDPAAIGGRRQADGVRAVTDVPFFAYQRPVRVIAHAPAYNHSGDVEFFAVLGGGSGSLFTNNDAGRRARQIADAYVEYVFPRATAAPFTLGGGRQSNLLDMRNGYFSKNPLGLWLHVWVEYTDAAFLTPAGRAALADLAARNGVDLDGTPIITTTSEIDALFKMGLVTKEAAPLTDARRYAICPVVKDPTDGGIPRDATMNYTRKADGSPLEPEFPLNFESLRTTGRWFD